jgi:sulfofructose kinase
LAHAALDWRFWVPQFPPAQARTRATAFREDIGGPGPVGALTVARLGGQPVLLGRRGDDDAGARLERALAGAGIDVQTLRAFPGAQTSVSVIIVTPDGERHIISHLGGGLPDDPSWLPLDTIRDAGAVLLDWRWPQAARRVAAAARGAGVPVVLDLDRDDPAAWELAAMATHTIADSALAAGTGGADALLERLTAIGTWAAVTAGREGAIHRGGRVPAFAVTAIDSTGAGDVYHAAFALALAERRTARDALVFASAAAALRCERADVPYRADVIDMLERSHAS